MATEYKVQVTAADAETATELMNTLSAEGWDIFAITNGYVGGQFSPPGVTFYMRRPLATAATPVVPTQPRVDDSAAASPPHKPRRK